MLEEYKSVLDAAIKPITVSHFANNFSISKDKATEVIECYKKDVSDGPLWALYEVCGILKGSTFSEYFSEQVEVVKYIVAPESELEIAKEQFQKVLSTGLHSIQRTNPKETRVYGRQWDNNDDLIGKSVVQKEPPKNITKDDKEKKNAEKELKTASVVQNKSGNVMSLFAKAKRKNTEKNEPKEEVIKKEKTSPRKVEKVSTEKIIKTETTSPDLRINTSKRQRIESDDDLFDPNDEEPNLPDRQSPIQTRMSPKRKRTKNNVKDNQKYIVPKKEPLLESHDEENCQKSLNKDMPTNEKRRTKKIEKVIETFVDEDGFLVSKEVNRSVEISPEKMSPEKPKPQLKAAVPGEKIGKKNATITSFFKRT